MPGVFDVTQYITRCLQYSWRLRDTPDNSVRTVSEGTKRLVVLRHAKRVRHSLIYGNHSTTFRPGVLPDSMAFQNGSPTRS